MVPLALLHGFTGSPAAWNGVLTALRPELVVVPALWGHGATASTPPETFDDEVDRLAGILRERATGYHLAGYSLGGRMAVGLLARHPDLFRSATLIGAHPGLTSETDREVRREADERWCTLLELDGIEAFVDAWEAQPIFATQGDTLAAQQRKTRLAHDPAGLVASLRVTGLGAMPSYRDALSSLLVPTTWMAGSRDDKFVRIAREMESLMPHATLHLVPNAGHNVLLEAPGAVISVLRAALEAA